jgi:Histidine kinase-, DNA gyrase B-, and HSP90-like ATPase
MISSAVLVNYEVVAWCLFVLAAACVRQCMITYEHRRLFTTEVKDLAAFSVLAYTVGMWTLGLHSLCAVSDSAVAEAIYPLFRAHMFFIAPILLLFSMQITRTPFQGRWALILALSFISSVFITAVNFYTPTVLLAVAGDYEPALDFLTIAHWTNFSLIAAIALGLTYFAYCQAKDRQRHRLKWLLMGYSVAISFGIVSFSQYHQMGIAGSLIASLCIALAVTQHRLITVRNILIQAISEMGGVAIVTFLIILYLQISFTSWKEVGVAPSHPVLLLIVWCFYKILPSVVYLLQLSLSTLFAGYVNSLESQKQQIKKAVNRCSAANEIQALIDDFVAQHMPGDKWTCYIGAQYTGRTGDDFFEIDFQQENVISYNTLVNLDNDKNVKHSLLSLLQDKKTCTFGDDNFIYTRAGLQTLNSSSAIPIIHDDTTIGFFLFSRSVNQRFYSEKNVDIMQYFGSEISPLVADIIHTETLKQKFKIFEFELKDIFHSISTTISNLPAFLDEFHSTKPEQVLQMTKDSIVYAVEQSQRGERLVANEISTPLQFNFNGQIKRVLQLFRSVKFESNLKSLPLYYGRIDAIASLIHNLVHNACEAAMATAEVAVATSTNQAMNKIYLRVSDKSGGIPDSILKTLWSDGKSTKGDGRGSGLGIIKRIVDEQGGLIETQVDKGVGTTFIVTLPVIAPDGD